MRTQLWERHTLGDERGPSTIAIQISDTSPGHQWSDGCSSQSIFPANILVGYWSSTGFLSCELPLFCPFCFISFPSFPQKNIWHVRATISKVSVLSWPVSSKQLERKEIIVHMGESFGKAISWKNYGQEKALEMLVLWLSNCLLYRCNYSLWYTLCH